MSGLSPTGLHPNSLVVVLPIKMPPAALARSTAGASTVATLDFIVREPAQVKRYTKAGFDAFWNAVAR